MIKGKEVEDGRIANLLIPPPLAHRVRTGLREGATLFGVSASLHRILADAVASATGGPARDARFTFGTARRRRGAMAGPPAVIPRVNSGSMLKSKAASSFMRDRTWRTQCS